MVYDNSPALSWIRVSGGVVTYNNKIYILTDYCTEKKYIYWNAEKPDTYESSNEILKETHTRFLVLINDGGMHTIVRSKSDNFNITFDGTKKRDELNQEKINGLYKNAEDVNDKVQKKFSAIEQNLDGITQIVGEYDADTKKSVSEIKQKMDSIQLSVETQQTSMESVKSTLAENKEAEAHIKLRDDVISKFLDLVNFLGSYEVTMQSIMRDGRLSPEGQKNADGIDERETLKTSHETLRFLTERLVNTLKEVSEIKEFKEKVPLQIEALKNVTIPGIEKSTENLINMVNNVGEDNIYEPLDMKTVFALIERYIADMVKHKDNLDKILVLGYGGEIISTVSKMFLNESQGGFSFSRRINDNIQKATDLKVSLDGVSSTVREQDGRISSLSGEIIDTKDNLTGEINQTKDSLTGEISKTKDNLTGEINKAKAYLSSEISQTKDAIRTKVDSSEFRSEINQLSNSISSKVSSRDMESYLSQGPDELQYGFNRLGQRFGSSFKMNRYGLTITNGFVSTSSLTAPTGEQAVISLFNNEDNINPFGEVYAHLNSSTVETSSYYRGRYGYKTVELLPRIDARDTTGSTYGKEIRLQISQTDYVKVGVNEFQVFQASGLGSSGIVFAVDRDGAYVYPEGIRTKLGTDKSDTGGVRMIREKDEAGISLLFPNGDKLRIKDRTNQIGIERKNYGTDWINIVNTSNFAPSYHTHSGYASSSDVSSLESQVSSLRSRISRLENGGGGGSGRILSNVGKMRDGVYIDFTDDYRVRIYNNWHIEYEKKR